ncbi:MAG TPA: hypothetical protein VGQ02_11105 [Candidatus Limnocylindrales bacterium]|jgi:hypothetical protein|nr:hypothetical protein [Candidatus Limnocylindrales bacterium]
MSRRPAPDSPDAARYEPDVDEPGALTDGNAEGTVAIDLTSLPIAGLTRRRIAIIAAAMLAAWIVIAFARQVSDASAAATRAQDIATGNAMLRLEVAAMERELDAIARQRFVEQQARAYRVGGAQEIPFALAPDAPALAADAPGSAAVRLGADGDGVSPLERWLTVLFGPSD